MIQFFSQDRPIPVLKRRDTKKWLKMVIESYGYSVGDLSYIFCSDSYILETNQNFLDHDYFTDIITFDYVKDGRISGDMIISVDTVQSNSAMFQQNFLDELDRVMVHGVLHLLGYQDETDDLRAVMRHREDLALALR